jgi:hypothetical protein
MPVTITQSVTPSEYRSERLSTCIPANCSGLANSGVPANAPGDEMPALEADSSTVFARPRSIILAVTPLSSFNLTMMLVGLISRWTRCCSLTAANPAATCVAISSASFTSSRPDRLMSFSSVSPSTNSIA